MKIIKKAMIMASTGAAICAHAQSSVTIYGVADSAVTYTNKVNGNASTTGNVTGSKTSLMSGVLLGSRLGFRGTEDLGGGYRAIFNLESGINLDTGTISQGGVMFGRRSVVGLSGPFGTVVVGRIREYTGDNFVFYNGQLDFGSITLNAHDGTFDRSTGAGRVNNAIRYDTPNSLGGFTGSAFIGLGETTNSSSAGQSYGFTAKYDTGPWSMIAGYFQNRVGPTPSDTIQASQGAAIGTIGATALKSLTLGLRYEVPGLALYGSVSRVRQPLATRANPTNFAALNPPGRAFVAGGSNNDETAVLDVGVKWIPFGNGVALLANYAYERVRFIGAPTGKLGQLNLGAHYYLSKRTTLYGFVARQRTKDMYSLGIADGAPGRNNSQTMLVGGVRHLF